MVYIIVVVVIIIIIIIIFKAHQHKAAGRKTRLDIQNYGCIIIIETYTRYTDITDLIYQEAQLSPRDRAMRRVS